MPVRSRHALTINDSQKLPYICSMAKISINLQEGSLKKEEIILGIDLGTTNSLVAYIDKQSNNPIAISDKNSKTIVPSLIYFNADNHPVIGDSALPFLTLQPERTIYSAKRLMGKSYNDIKDHQQYFSYKVIDDNSDQLVKVRVGDNFYSPIELSSFILKELKFRAEKHLQQEISKVVITVPAYFNDSQRQATRDAGKLAGLDVMRIINEPTAASLAYGLGLNRASDLKVAVYDLGGGTFDISILQISNGIFEVLSTHGDTYLGGDDFDRALLNHWVAEYGLDEYGLFKDLSASQELRLLAEKAKKSLSAQAEFKEVWTWQNRQYVMTCTEQLFNSLIEPIINRTLTSVHAALRDAELSSAEIDDVVLVGGSTRVPLIKEKLAQIFGKEKINDSINPDEVVALGAAVEADILAGNRKDFLLLDVTPLSLGIETLGGLMDVLIPRNSKVPAKLAKQYTTSVDGQVNLRVNVYQGERELVAENRKLASFDLKGIPAMPAGLPKIEVIFYINADGILKVEASELRSGTKTEIEVKPQYGLDDATVEKMLLDSIKNAEADVKMRMIVEAKTEAEQLIYVTERFIDKNESLLSNEEVQKTALLINDLKNSLESQDKDVILRAIDELNEYTRPFAERLMDISVKTALKGKSIDA